MPRSCKLLLLPLAFLLAGWFSLFALHRFIDADEGFYLLAARLVVLHRTPYLDFFYQQAPLLPYVYAGWLKLFGVTWVAARMLAAVLSTALGLLVVEHVCHETRRWQSGLAAALLFACSTTISAWFPVAKTFSLSILPLFAAYMIAARLLPETPLWLVALSGAFCALSVDTRLYLVVLGPILLGWILWLSPVRRVARGFSFVGGFVAGLLPCLILFAASPRVFLFDNLGFHARRTDAGLIGFYNWKLHILKLVLTGNEENGLQFTMVALTGLVLLLVLRRWRSGAVLAFLIALAIAVVSILPTPPNTQYFSACMPFLIVAAVCAASEYLESASAPGRRLLVAVASLFAVVFLVLTVSGVRNYLMTGDHMIGVAGRRDAPNWSFARVRAVSGIVDQLAAPGEEIVSVWPGYLFESRALPYPGFENDYGRAVSDKITAEERLQYHLLSKAEVELCLAAHGPRIVVVGNQGNSRGPVLKDAALLESDGYRFVERVGVTLIYAYDGQR